ncbi:MAG: ATP synthase F1 subunit delta [Bacteroidota bacterium]
MSVQRVASRYAKSLIDLAVEQNKLDRILGDVEAFKKATKNRDFFMLMKSPIVHASKKSKVLEALFAGKFDELTMAFLRILVDKGREEYLPEIAKEFVVQYKQHMHISTIKITSAAPLTKAEIKAITDKLRENKDVDENIDIITKVDPELLGGFIIEFEDKVYDASASHKLAKLKKGFVDNLYVSQIVAK